VVSWGSFIATLLIIAGIWKKENSEKMRFAAYAGFVLLMIIIFLHLQIPFGIGVTLPLLTAGCIALYTSSRKNPRKKLFPGKNSFASLPERFADFLFLGMIVFASLFVFQEGADYLLLNRYGKYLLLLPLAGCLLWSGKRLRDHLFAAGTGFIVLAGVFAFFTAFADTLWITDISIIFIFIFWEYQLLLLFRGILPEIRNLSLIFLVILLFANGKILPGVCDTNITSLSVFILYIIGDNWERIIKTVRRRLDPEKHLLAKPPRQGFAVQAWCAGAFFLITFTGKKGVLPMLFLAILLFCTAILKSLIQEKKNPGAIIRKCRKAGEILPLLPECCVIVLFAVIQTLLWDRGFLAAVTAAGCAGACIWNLGIVIAGKDIRKLPVHASLYHAVSAGGIFLFMLLLFFYRTNSSVAASTGLILTGCALLGEGAYTRSIRYRTMEFLLRKWVAYIAVALGFAVVVLPGKALSPVFWEPSAVACGALAFFAVNVYYILENKLKKQEV
ncbi:MAG: hypothetical protein IKA79_00255, partial [Lentisphaeria bacterium]|nr:hypothetical protein [Lentisphaeria bacterium]